MPNLQSKPITSFFARSNLYTLAGWSLALLPSLTLLVVSLAGLKLTGLKRKGLRFAGLQGTAQRWSFTLVFIGFMVWLLPLLFNQTPLRAIVGDSLQALLVLILVASPILLPWEQLPAVTRGFALGSMTLVLVSCIQVIILGETRAQGWLSHPNIWAMQAVGIGLLQLSFLGGGRRISAWVILGLGACLVTTLLTGSRTALLSLLLGLALISLHSQRYLLRSLLILVGLGFFLLLVIPSWRQSVLNTVSWLVKNPVASSNLFFSSELLSDGVWQAQQVSITSHAISLPREWAIQKTAREGWSRLQQQVILFPQQNYALSGEFLVPEGQEAGFWGIGQTKTERAELVVSTNLTLRLDGAITLLRSETTGLDKGWQKLEVVFKYLGQHPVRWWLGVTPDQSENVGDPIHVRAVQLEQGEVSVYHPTAPANLAVSNAQTRLPAFRVAWTGFVEKPFIGQGLHQYAAYYETHPPGQNPFITVHAHNFFLQTLFERGLLGFIGILLVIGGLAQLGSHLVGQQSDARHYGAGYPKAFGAFLLCILTANLLDYTLWSAASFYLLTAYASCQVSEVSA